MQQKNATGYDEPRLVSYSKSDFLRYFDKAIEEGNNAIITSPPDRELACITLNNFIEYFQKASEQMPVGLTALISEGFKMIIDEVQQDHIYVEKIKNMSASLRDDINRFFDIYTENALITPSAKGQIIFQKQYGVDEDVYKTIINATNSYIKDFEKNLNSSHCGPWKNIIESILEIPQLKYYPANAILLFKTAAEASSKCTSGQDEWAKKLIDVLRDLRLLDNRSIVGKYKFLYSCISPSIKYNFDNSVTCEEVQNVTKYLSGLANIIQATVNPLSKSLPSVHPDLMKLNKILASNLVLIAKLVEYGTKEFPVTHKQFLGVLNILSDDDNVFSTLRANIFSLHRIYETNKYRNPSQDELDRGARLAMQICDLHFNLQSRPKSVGFDGQTQKSVNNILDKKIRALMRIHGNFTMREWVSFFINNCSIEEDFGGEAFAIFKEIKKLQRQCPQLFSMALEIIKMTESEILLFQASAHVTPGFRSSGQLQQRLL